MITTPFYRWGHPGTERSTCPRSKTRKLGFDPRSAYTLNLQPFPLHYPSHHTSPGSNPGSGHPDLDLRAAVQGPLPGAILEEGDTIRG